MEAKIRDLEIDMDSISFDRIPANDADEMLNLYYANKTSVPHLLWLEKEPTVAVFLNHFLNKEERPLFMIRGDVAGVREDIGFFWLSSIDHPFKCEAGFCLMRRFWGKGSDTIVKQAANAIHEESGIDRVFAFTPWPTAKNMVERANFTPVALLPGYSKGRDVYGFVHKAEVKEE